jgi:hypothetical protein
MDIWQLLMCRYLPTQLGEIRRRRHTGAPALDHAD